MDTSATVHKAVGDAEKQKHCQEGYCFKCSKQGHIARNCPDRKPHVQASTLALAATTDNSKAAEQAAKVEDLLDGNVIADYAMKLLDKARDAFVKKVDVYG
jgi:Zinc knuckle